MNRISTSQKAEALLGKFQLTRNTAISDDPSFFDITTATENTVWLEPNGGFCSSSILVPLENLARLADQFLPCDREQFLLHLCGENYNRC